MKNTIQIINNLIGIILFLSSCDNNTAHNYKIPLFPVEYSATTECLNKEVMFSFYSQPLLVDSLLIIPDVNQDPMIFIYNKNKGHLLKQVGPKGRGKGELVNPVKFSLNLESKHLYIHDHGKNSIIKYDMNKIMQDSMHYYHEYPLSNDFRNNNNFAFLKDSLFYYNSNTKKIQLSTLRRNIDSYNEIYPLPKFTEELSNSFLGNWTINTVSPDGTKYVSLTSLGGIMEIYHLFPEIRMHKRLYFIEPIFSISSNKIQPTENTIYGFNCVYASNKYIYATIFAEKTPQIYPHVIWQLDWEGRPISKIISPNEIGNFTVDEDNLKIYAITFNSGHEEAITSIDITPSLARELP